jgi:hypothetical protein
MRELRNNLILRSGPQGRVSKGGHEHRVCCPSFETPRCARLLRVRFYLAFAFFSSAARCRAPT